MNVKSTGKTIKMNHSPPRKVSVAQENVKFTKLSSDELNKNT